MSGGRIIERPAEPSVLMRVVDGFVPLIVTVVAGALLMNVLQDDRVDPLMIAAIAVGAARMLLRAHRVSDNPEPLDDHDDIDERLDQKYTFRVRTWRS